MTIGELELQGVERLIQKLERDLQSDNEAYNKIR